MSDATRSSGDTNVQYVVANGGGVAAGAQNGDVYVHGAVARHSPYKILMMAANPAVTQELALDEEAREIEQRLRMAREREAFELVTRWAVRADDMMRHLNEIRPHIVHFSGHGSPAGEIMLATADRTGRPVDPAALGRVFRVLRGDIRVVMLNACYSAVQAERIGAHIDYVVGMRAAVDDDSATVFSAQFYSALGYGRPVAEAFEQAVTAIELHGLPGADVPELLVRQGAEPNL